MKTKRKKLLPSKMPRVRRKIPKKKELKSSKSNSENKQKSLESKRSSQKELPQFLTQSIIMKNYESTFRMFTRNSTEMYKPTKILKKTVRRNLITMGMLKIRDLLQK